MKHEMKIKAIYFEKIKKGEKIYEVRLNDEKRRAMDVGDVLVLKKEPDQVEELYLEIKDLVYFDSFDEMVNTLPSEKIGFAGMEKQAIVDVYHSFYSPADERKHGVVAIKVQVMK